jgi:NADPH-dependent curcumin reductase
MPENLQVLLAARPKGAVGPECFALREAPLPEPAHGEVLVRHRFLSLDPYMRGRMDDVRSYSPPVALGAVMEGQSVGQVVADAAGFRAGEWVLGGRGWQLYSAVPAAGLSRIDAEAAPPSAYLGVLGMPGTTAWVGVTKILGVKPGETFCVSAASGAVGQVAGQLAKRIGARAVGIAGGAGKCRHVVEALGFDACCDHRDAALAQHLAEACPDGVDAAFENTGAAPLHAVWPLLNEFARVAFCGMVGETSADPRPPGPSLVQVVRKRLRLEGFIVYDHPREFAAWRKLGAGLLARGELAWREDVTQGLERAPEAFRAMLAGRNFGKTVVALG